MWRSGAGRVEWRLREVALVLPYVLFGRINPSACNLFSSHSFPQHWPLPMTFCVRSATESRNDSCMVSLHHPVFLPLDWSRECVANVADRHRSSGAVLSLPSPSTQIVDGQGRFYRGLRTAQALSCFKVIRGEEARPPLTLTRVRFGWPIL